MVKLFSNKELSACLGINPARWKRWSREFLPPDPLAGLQSGYARQYYLNDAFTVYLGGHLVSCLRMAIPEARMVLGDLQAWFRENGYRFDPGGSRSEAALTVLPGKSHTLTVYPTSDGGFAYRVKGLIHAKWDTLEGRSVRREVFTETWLTPGGQGAAELVAPRTIALTLILEKFISAIDPQGQQFPQLHPDASESC
ncbi:MAG: hypothetical protein ABIL58_14660 [Pseudomonadota bacterium]